MECDELRGDSEVEADSDHEDADGGGVGGEGGCSGGWLGHPLYNFHTDLESCETGTVRRRTKTIVTPKMAMESFRLSFLNDDQDVNFDAILGELYELESQLNSTQTELSRSLSSGGPHPLPPTAFQDGDGQGSNEPILVSEQEELDQLAAEITRGLHYHKSNGHYRHHQHHHHQTVVGSGVVGGGGGEGLCDTAETDSAFSDNASLPSSESFTSMATVSSSADTTSSSSGETYSMHSTSCGVHSSEEEQIARSKAEKICIALEKIKESKIRKLFVRAFAKDGSSKSILVDEKMSVAQVCSQLADKNHVRLNHKLSVVELMPELLMERILEDHDSLVENMVMWTKDSKNKVMFEERMDKYDLFRHPEKYLLSPTVTKQVPLAPQEKDRLIQEFFAPDGVCVPAVEGPLYLKSDGKKAWKKFYFVLRASGLYYSPKGKASKNPKDLACLVQFEYVEVYRGLGWKKKYHAPTDYCFALKFDSGPILDHTQSPHGDHFIIELLQRQLTFFCDDHPQIQKKTSKYIRYFCAETEAVLNHWVMAIRTVKLGKQMLHNYEQLTHDISIWDLRQPETGAVVADDSVCQLLNHDDLSDSRMSVPEFGIRHSVIQVLNQSLVRNSTSSDMSRDILGIEVLAIPPHKSSEAGSGCDGRSLSGSIGSSSIGSGASESGHKTPVKRVSFSATHSIINGDSGEQIVKHRDSIISASTDSSEDSNSSGEMRLGSSFRGKMRPKLPVTTETTRQLADMCNVTMDETAECIYAETHHRGSQSAFSRSDRRRSSMQERRGSCGSSGSETSQRSSQLKSSTLSPNLKQHSLDRGSEVSTIHKKQSSPGSEGHYQHVRRKSESSAVPDVTKEEPASSTYSTVYSPLREEQRVYGEVGSISCTNQHENSEPIYNQIRSPKSSQPAQASRDRLSSTTIPPPPQFRETVGDSHHIPSFSSHGHREPSPSPYSVPPVHVQSMQVPPPPPPANSTVPSAQTTNNQQKAHPLKESHYSTVASLSHSTHSKSSPPPTFPKPQNSSAVNVRSTTPTLTGLPKHHVPPPFRMPSSESGCSLRSNVDSGSPVRTPTHSSVPTMGPKLPPPTLPKSSHPAAVSAISVTGSCLRSSSPSSRPPSGDGQPKKHMNLVDPSLTRPGGEGADISENEMASCPAQSPSLPFLSELSKRTHPEPGIDNTGVELRNGQPLLVSQQHRRSASTGGVVGKFDKKAPPPPPPKRSESTRLSADLAKQQSEHNGTCVEIPDPIYENFDGIMDIDELPPPPPELLMDITPSDYEEQSSGSAKKPRPPPPPPKRSRETQLSSHEV